jgi:hypothetical protein
MSRSYLFTVAAASLVFLAAHASAQSPSTTADALQENVSLTIKPDAKAEADGVARDDEWELASF